MEGNFTDGQIKIATWHLTIWVHYHVRNNIPGLEMVQERGSCGYEAYTQATSLHLITHNNNHPPMKSQQSRR